jgi:peptidoglycan/LPS O-acetylase OafA/YrhL
MISGSNISLTKLLTVIFSGYLIPGTMQILWFIPMIVLFFIVSPLFRFIDSNPKLYIYLIPTTLIISTLITRGINPLVNFILFISVYLLGMLTSHYRENADDLLNKNIHLLHFLFLVFTGLDIFNIYTNNFYNPLGNNIFLRFWAKLLLSGILLHYLLKFDLMLNNKLNLYAKYSFGIFFIHGYVITIYNKILPDTFFNKNSIFFFVIFFMLVFFTTLGILVATKKTLHKYSRYVIGV